MNITSESAFFPEQMYYLMVLPSVSTWARYFYIASGSKPKERAKVLC